MRRQAKLKLRGAPAVLVALTGTLAACAASPQDEEPETPRVILVREADPGASFAALVSGELGVNAQDCVTLGDRVLIAPAGSSATRMSVDLEGYGTYRLGEAVSVGGGEEEIEISQLGDDQSRCFDADDEIARYVVMSPGTG